MGSGKYPMSLEGRLWCDWLNSRRRQCEAPENTRIMTTQQTDTWLETSNQSVCIQKSLISWSEHEWWEWSLILCALWMRFAYINEYLHHMNDCWIYIMNKVLQTNCFGINLMLLAMILNRNCYMYSVSLNKKTLLFPGN